MTPWQRVFHEGIGPLLSVAALEALHAALVADSREIVQNTTTFPPPLQCLARKLVEMACPIGYALWKGCGLATVGEVEAAFAELCQRADEALGEPAAVRHFLNHVDETDRDALRWELLSEVGRELARRQASAA
jgi:hypothetical protein